MDQKWTSVGWPLIWRVVVCPLSHSATPSNDANCKSTFIIFTGLPGLDMIYMLILINHVNPVKCAADPSVLGRFQLRGRQLAGSRHYSLNNVLWHQLSPLSLHFT